MAEDHVKLVRNLVMFVMRLCHVINTVEPGNKTAEQAIRFLKDNHLMTGPFRD